MTLLRLAPCLAALALLAAPAPAQTGTLDEAVTAYGAGEWERATALFASLAEDPTASTGVREEALRYLGRTYIAQNQREAAREALDQLLALEPPLIEVDPEIEHPELVKVYYEARRDLQGGDYAVPADPGLTTLAVLDFTNTSVSRYDAVDPLRQGLASMMIHTLSGATDLRVIERERIQWLLDELELQQGSGAVDPATAVRAGRLLGATTVLFGAYTVQGERLWISARLVKVETGEILLAEQVFGTEDGLFDLVDELSLEVAQAVNATLDRETVGERRATDSYDAMLAYSEGLALLEAGDHEGAHARFRAALDHDPDYTRAQTKMEALRPTVAAR
jgi:TolB-like protein